MLHPDASYSKPSCGCSHGGLFLSVEAFHGPRNPTVLVCAVCKNEENLQTCAGCHAIFYCGKQHQKQDWKNHKASCKPWEIQTREDGSKIWIASRDLEAGTLIYVDLKPTLTYTNTADRDQGRGLSCELLTTNFPYNHSCSPNTRFDTFLQRELKVHFEIPKEMVVVHTLVPIAQGEELTVGGGMRYPHLGTHYRRQVMRDHHNFICRCSRCRDPTELGTYFSGVTCQKCRTDCTNMGETDPLNFGYFLPIDPLEFGGQALWECRGCGDKKPAATVLAPVIEAYDALKAKNYRFGVRRPGREEFLTGLIANYRGQILHPNHWILIKATDSMIFPNDVLDIKVTDVLIPIISPHEHAQVKERLEKYVERAETIFSVTSKITPGLTKQRGELLKAYAAARLFLANDRGGNWRQKTIEEWKNSQDGNKETLKILKESITIGRMDLNPLDIGGQLTDFVSRMNATQTRLKETIQETEDLYTEMRNAFLMKRTPDLSSISPSLVASFRKFQT